MAFPSGPSNGQKHIESGVTYIWVSSYGVWDIYDPNQDISAGDVLSAIKTVDGSGSGLDADTLDGLSSNTFVKYDSSNNATINSSSNSTNPYTAGGVPKLAVVAGDGGVPITVGSSNSDLMYIRNQTGGTGKFCLQTYTGGNTGEIQLQPYGGNVGVGTAAPSEKLHVDVGTSGGVRIEGDSWCRLQLKHNTGHMGITHDSNGLSVYNWENNAYLTTFKEDGKVGINTDNPGDGYATQFSDRIKLHVNGGAVSTHGSAHHYNGIIGEQGTYIERVILLLSLDNDGPEGTGPYRHVDGRFTKHRSNGCCTQKTNIIDFHAHKQYNSENAEWNIRHQQDIPLITCMYNGEKYLAINLNYGLPHGANVMFQGFFSDMDVFGTQISYYDVRGTVLNSEIRDSITVLS